MCGIFSMIIHPTKKERDYDQLRALVNALALFSADRGTDATGLALVQDDGNVINTVKEAKPSYELIRKKSWRKTLKLLGPDTHYVLGHTRKATRGSNESRNAHPFEFEHKDGLLVGVHNGTIINADEINPVATFQVDSANVYKALADEKDKIWSPILEKLDGSFALCWYADGAFYVGKNYGSPLEVTKVDDLDITLFTSTEHMAKAALALVGVNGIWSIAVTSGQLRTYSWMTKEMNSQDFKIKALESKVTTTSVYAGGTTTVPHYHGYHRGRWNDRPFKGTGNRADQNHTIKNGFAMCHDCTSVEPMKDMESYGMGKWLCKGCFNSIERMAGGMD